MERSSIFSYSSLFTAVLLAAAVVLTGCSDSLTGATPQDQNVTVQQQAGHNNSVMDDGGGGGSTTPSAGHNTTDED